MKRLLFPILLITLLIVGVSVAYSIWTASPGSAQEYMESGKRYFADKRYSEATIQFLNAVRKDPRSRDALNYLAQSYIQQGDIESGAKNLHALLEYYPDDVEANLQLGRIFLGAGGGDPGAAV